MKHAKLVRMSFPVWVAVASTSLAAQERGGTTLQGQVVDSLTEHPMEGVLLRLDSGAETRSDRAGRFTLQGLEAGTHVLAALTLDCRVSWVGVELAAGGTSEVTISMPAPPGGARRAETGVPERPRSGGRLVTAAEIDAMQARSLRDVIGRVAPGMLSRGRNSLLSPNVEFVVVVDGIRAADGDRTLDNVRPEDVETLELAPGSSAGWEFGSAGSAGLVRIVTRQGTGGTRVPNAHQCVVPGMRGG